MLSAEQRTCYTHSACNRTAHFYSRKLNGRRMRNRTKIEEIKNAYELKSHKRYKHGTMDTTNENEKNTTTTAATRSTSVTVDG